MTTNHAFFLQIIGRFGMQLFGELDYVREANNCERFRELYGGWKNVMVPDVCTALTRKKVLVMEWVDGQKGPWPGDDGIKMVRIGLKCSVDQLVSELEPLCRRQICMSAHVVFLLL